MSDEKASIPTGFLLIFNVLLRAQMRRGWKLVQTIELVAKDAKMVKRLELSRDGKTLLVVSFSKCIVAFDVVGDVEDKKRNKEKEVLKNDDNNNDDHPTRRLRLHNTNDDVITPTMM